MMTGQDRDESLTLIHTPADFVILACRPLVRPEERCGHAEDAVEADIWDFEARSGAPHTRKSEEARFVCLGQAVCRLKLREGDQSFPSNVAP